MNLPETFRSDDLVAARRVIRENPFGSLISVVGGVPLVSHLPFVLDGDHIIGHLARRNPHTRLLDGESLVTFVGPHAYVSARWYTRPEAHVPTWNYVAVHVYGRPELIESAPAVRQLARLIEPEAATSPVVDALAPRVVAFRIPLDRVEFKAKLSQNREPMDAERVRVALDGGTESERAVARWMEWARRGS